MLYAGLEGHWPYTSDILLLQQWRWQEYITLHHTRYEHCRNYYD